jgi:hypothetical protein
MNILVSAHPHYNYLDATIVSGLQKLSHTVVGKDNNWHNYCQPEPAPPYDLFIQCHAEKGPELRGVPNIMLWGEDYSQEWPKAYNRGFDAVFVRDYLGGGLSNVFPINFGVEERYLCAPRDQRKQGIRCRDIDIGFWGNIDTKNRVDYCNHLMEVFGGKFNIQLEGQVFCQPDDYWTKWTGTYRPHDIEYYKTLANTKILVSFHGHGPDCARHWEILAAGAVCFIEQMDTIQCPPALVHGKHCFIFNSKAQLTSQIYSVLSDPIQYQAIADQGRHSASGAFSTRSRAKYLLSALAEIGLITGGQDESSIETVERTSAMAKG